MVKCCSARTVRLKRVATIKAKRLAAQGKVKKANPKKAHGKKASAKKAPGCKVCGKAKGR